MLSVIDADVQQNKFEKSGGLCCKKITNMPTLY